MHIFDLKNDKICAYGKNWRVGYEERQSNLICQSGDQSFL